MENIRQYLRRGDQKVIAKLARVSEETVKKTLAKTPTRNNPRVVAAAERLVKARQRTEATIARDLRNVGRK